jgi:hypothetical protein
MDVVAYRLLTNGNSIEEISKLTGLPVDQVLQEIEKYKKRQPET